MCCEGCCKKCCYSTPPVTFVTVGVMVSALLGFVVSCAYGISRMSDSGPTLGNGTTVVISVVTSAVLLTVLPLVFAMIMSYFVTGYLRDVLFSSFVKSCIRPFCGYTLILVLFLYFSLWLLLSIGLAAIMSSYVGAVHICQASSGRDPLCFTSVSTDFQYYSVCGEELTQLCHNGLLDAGLAFSVALIFSILITIGFAMQLLIAGMNMVLAKDNLEIREAQNPQNGFLLECKQ
eukprot:Em0020g366a